MRLLVALLGVVACVAPTRGATPLGRFHPDRDLMLAHFDLKTDVDDAHSIAAVATMLADPRLAAVRCHAVAGAYGKQEGLYVPANRLFEAAFGEDWSDAHADHDRAVEKVATLALETLRNGGDVWIAEGGQSDFSAAVIGRVRGAEPGVDTKRFRLVQHADWNEEETTPERLAYVKRHADYHKIPSGNAVGNGSPGFKSDEPVAWRRRVAAPVLVAIWESAIEIAQEYNGLEGRYNNPAVASGGLDFSDACEACWILGFEQIVDAEAFFEEFGGSRE